MVKEFRYNKALTIKELATRFHRSERTIYRWLKGPSSKEVCPDSYQTKKKGRARKYPLTIFNRIVELKKEAPQRSAPMIHRKLEEECPESCPSLSTVQKFLRTEGLVNKERIQKQGYKKFERTAPNDLWQIDLAGAQTIGHLKSLHLIALIDDCSRYVVAGQYFRTEQGINVMKVLKNAVEHHGRPNQILSDNGTQFKNVLGKLATKYAMLLEMMDVTPIFAERNHPETKGKLERWFQTVIQMFLIEARLEVIQKPKWTLAEFNVYFHQWLEWYNTKKPHGSLPQKKPPAELYFKSEKRVYRPLDIKIQWDKWLHKTEERKVRKYNTITYHNQTFTVPPGYMLTRVSVIEYDDKIEIFHKDQLLITHPYQVSLSPMRYKTESRVVRKNGTLAYHGTSYTVDYKLAGKTVEVQEVNNGQTLLVHLAGKLIKTILLKS